MKILSIRIGGFGALEKSEWPDLSPESVSVYGPNESGKSTLLYFLYNMIFGFRPARLENHPYAPWSGVEMDGEVKIELDSGRTVGIHRRLLSAPWGRIETDGEKKNLANHTVPGLGTIKPDLFNDLYALSRRDMEFPENTWDEVKDRIIGGSGVERIRSPRGVWDDLEKEGDNLWRSTQRGRAKTKLIREEIERLGRKIHDARGADDEIREKEERLLSLRKNYENLQEKKIKIRGRLIRADRLGDLKRKTERIDELLEDAGDLTPYESLSADPGNDLRILQERIGELEASLDKRTSELKNHRASIELLTPLYKHILASGKRIREAVATAAVLHLDRSRLDDLEEEHREMDVVILEKGGELFEKRETAFSLPAFSSRDLDSRISAFRHASRRLEGARAEKSALDAAVPASFRLPLLLALGGILLALSIILFGITPFSISLVAIGALLLLGSALSGGNAFARRASFRKEGEKKRILAGQIQKMSDEEDSCRRRVADLLSGVDLLPSRLAAPDDALFRDLSDLHHLLDERDATLRRIDSVKARIVERESVIAAMAVEYECDRTDDVAQALEKIFEDARDVGKTHDEATERIPFLEKEADHLREKIGELRYEHDRVEELLRTLGDGELSVSVDLLARRRRAAAMAEEMIHEIEKDGDTLLSLKEEIRKMEEDDRTASILSDEEIARLEEEEEEIPKKIEELKGGIVAVEGDLDRLKAGPRAEDLEGERESLREEMALLERERDRLFLLAGIVREADRRYRAEHEPDIVKRTGKIFSRITGGRYERLSLEQEDGEGIHIHSRAATDFLPAEEPISRGTLDQLFLSLRLALVGHLEAGGETIPLFLDEVLAHWDDRRLDEGLGVLSGIAEERQVFCFTCRRSLHEAMLKRGASSLELRAPG